jgi:pimeloyl-ACP methyl ester carboxylesterase
MDGGGKTMRTLALISLSVAIAAAAWAQDITGDWQGTLKAGPQELRLIVHIERDGGAWKASAASIDQDDRGATIPADSVTVEGADVKISFAAVRGNYAGKLSADGTTMSGNWTQGPPLPLELRRATPETAWKDPSPHSMQFVNVDKNVRLEVLDWGGTGRPLVFVPGLGNTAHAFDEFAPKLKVQYHVYGITRRGFGASSAPATGYAADRLGDDVIAVLDALKIEKPVLAGHSLGGEELSSVGSRHPERVAGLVYLDAGYPYAFYDQALGDMRIALVDLERKLAQLHPGSGLADTRPLIKELLETTLPTFERDLREQAKNLAATPPAVLAAQAAQRLEGPTREIMNGMQKYTKIPVPILAIYAVPHDRGAQAGGDAAARAAQDARDEETTGAQAKAFETALPTAKVVRIPHANHFVFRSNEADVLREMNAFIAGLK